MYCKKIEVENFRNIEKAVVEFSEGVNVLAGANAQGKTNLLEAVFYPSMGRSFRGAKTMEMIRFGENKASVSLEYRDRKRDQKIDVKIYREKLRQVEKNGMKVDKLSDIVGSFRAVLFHPEHLSLIKSSPLERRNYLDMAIGRIRPLYIHTLQKYNHILKQRNALLRNAQTDRRAFSATVELWSDQLASAAAELSVMRYSYVLRARTFISESFSEMTGEREIPKVTYAGSSGQREEEYADYEEIRKKYFELLMGSHEREIATGATLWGIHKDDLTIDINGHRARIYGSQGQQRSLALAMKLAEGEICREEYGDYPVFLLDDVLSELDSERREYLLHRIRGKQVILTGCDPDLLKGEDEVKRIFVENGRYSEIG